MTVDGGMAGSSWPYWLVEKATMRPPPVNTMASCTPLASRSRVRRQRDVAIAGAVQFRRHGRARAVQVGQQRVQRGAAQVQAGFQRAVDPHVEPGLDGARQ